jgi:hypothetical protein
LQERIVREGWSPYYTQFGCAEAPMHNALLWAEAEAKANLRGVWEPNHPTNYMQVMQRWIGNSTCRPNPYLRPYCR